MSLCEVCERNMGKEVHHLQHQKEASPNGIIQREDSGLVFHKNHVANLVTLCEKCHREFHKTEDTEIQHKKVKTSEGYKLKDMIEFSELK